MDNIPSSNSDAAYLADVKRKISEWRMREPSVVSQALGFVGAGLGWVVNKIVPQSAIEGALHGFAWTAKITTTSAGTKNLNDLRDCDKNANSVINFHIAGGIAEGAAAGFFGAFALPADIPFVITAGLRLIWQIGTEYGFTADTSDERNFVFSILSAAGANTQAEKAIALATASQLMTMITKNTLKQMAALAVANPIGGAAAFLTVKQLAKQLGVNLTKRKALETIPIIGSTVGAAANGKFMYDVGEAAQRLYQERWLRDRGLITDTEIPPSGPHPSPDTSDANLVQG